MAEQEGDNISLVGGTYRVIISGKQTNDEFAVIDMLVPPNGRPNPHSHADFNKAFYVIKGLIVNPNG